MEVGQFSAILLLISLISMAQAQGNPKAVLIIIPESYVIIGENAVLKCEVQRRGGGPWTYTWFKNNHPLSEEDDGFYKFRPRMGLLIIQLVSESDSGDYTCKGDSLRDGQISEISDAVKLTVIAISKPTVRVNPQRSIYTGDTITLSCDLQQSRVWGVFWYKDHQDFQLHNSEYTNTFNMTVDNAGETMFQCRAHRRNTRFNTEHSDPVEIKVRERPKAVVSITPDNQVFSGEPVTLRCEIQDESVSSWQYSWYKEASNSQVSSVQEYTISSPEVTQAGNYTCKGMESGGSRSSHLSDAVALTVSVRPKPVASINTDKQVFTEETVTLRCDLQDESVSTWQYSWFKDPSLSPVSSVQEYTISGVEVTHTGNYTCKGSESGGSRSSHFSDAVTLTVSERPQAVLSVSPQSRLNQGDALTLSCEITDSDIDWTFSWYREVPFRHGVTGIKNTNGYIMYVELLSDSSRGSGGNYTLSASALNDSGKYVCRGERGEPAFYTQYSNLQPLRITARLKPVASINPDKNVTTGDIVSLRCEIQDESVSNWQYSWYKDDKPGPVSSLQVYNISGVELTHIGNYTCIGKQYGGTHSSHFSDAVTLTVSARPKPVVSIHPDKQVFSGDTVTLRCEIQDESVSRWQYSWYKDTSSSPVSSVQEYTISSVRVTHTGKYTCKGSERGGSRSSHLSDDVTLTVSERPKPVVSINPDNQVFSGDTVTLRCEIQDKSVSRWQYSWFKDSSLSPVSSVQEYTIGSSEVNHTGNYTCKGSESGGSRSSHLSDAVTLTVFERPHAVLSISPQSWLSEGDSVTLSCEVTDSSTDWTFSWYKEVPSRDSDGYILYQLRLLSDSRRGLGGNYTLSPCAPNHSGIYVCRGEKGEPVAQTHYSNSQPLWIPGESPQLSLILKPNKTQHFTGDSLSLSCEDQSNSTGWTVRRYTDSKRVLDCSQWGSVTGSTCNISFLSTSYTGVYWCESESGENSNPLNITVHVSSRSTFSHRRVGISVVFGLLLVALLITMIWLWSYRRDKEMQRKYKKTSEQNQSQTGDKDFQSGLAPFQSGKEHVYAPVHHTEINGTDKDSLEDTTYL